jgi:hypothetical protein
MSSPSSLRRWLWPKSLGGKLIVAGLLLVLLSVGMWIAAFFATESRVAKAKAAGERFGLPTDFGSLLGPPLSDTDNAAVPLRDATARAKREVYASKEYSGGGTFWKRPWTATALDELMADEEYESAVAEADHRHSYRSLRVVASPVWSYDNPFPKDAQFLATIEIAASRWLAVNGRHEDAVRRLLRLARLVRKWGDHEPLVFAAVSNAFDDRRLIDELNRRLRDTAELPSAVHDEIDEEIARREELIVRFLWVVQTERVALVDAYRRRWQSSWLFRPFTNVDQLCAIEYFNESMENMRKPILAGWADQKKLGDEAPSAQRRLDRFFYPVSSEAVPGFNFLFEERLFLLAKSRCLRIVNAMSRRRNFDMSPADLALPSACLEDPFNQRPLRVKHTKREPVVYSVGLDGLDDGGDFNERMQTGRDIGLGPPPKEAER